MLGVHKAGFRREGHIYVYIYLYKYIYIYIYIYTCMYVYKCMYSNTESLTERPLIQVSLICVVSTGVFFHQFCAT